MRWTGDLARGAWIRPRLGRWGTVCGTLPGGFEAYVRVLHPFTARADDDEREWGWREVARLTGRTLHALAQAPNLLASTDGATLDGWDVDLPELGRLEPRALAVLAALLAPATTTPDDITLAVWVGWGDLHPGYPGSTAGLGWPRTSPGPAADFLDTYRLHRLAAIDPQVAQAVEKAQAGPPAPVLQLPGRAYVLLAAGLDELADPDWPYGAGIGWTAPADRHGPIRGPMPQLLWPADHAWCVASEIDADSTIVGGSAALVESVLAAPELEAVPVPEDGDLTVHGDRVNPRPTPGAG